MRILVIDDESAVRTPSIARCGSTVTTSGC
jgi:hypothetical protein